MSLRFFISTVILFAASSGVASSGETFDAAVEASERDARAGVASQQRVDELDDEATALLLEYRAVLRDVERFGAYAERLRELIADQESDIRRRQGDIEKVETFERDLFPAMDRMLDAIGKFVRGDVPFLRKERDERIARLEVAMSRSDVTASEKFRQLMEAFQIESDYGRTIEAYRGTIDEAGRERVVDFLRIGRSLLVYQTLDAERSAVWDAATGAWRPLDAVYRNEVRRGLRIARKQVAPDLLILPFTAPVELKNVQ